MKKISVIFILALFLPLKSCLNDSSRHSGAEYNPDGIELVYVERIGKGSTAIKGFYIGKYEITQAQWEDIMGSNPSYFKGSNFPVEMVSWKDIQKFLSRLNKKTKRKYRLPTESEWVYAASGGTIAGICIKDQGYTISDSLANITSYIHKNDIRTHRVGIKESNELGIHDMNGNVWEWCQNLYDGSSSYRVFRGDSIKYSHVSSHLDNNPLAFKFNNLGFRILLPD